MKFRKLAKYLKDTVLEHNPDKVDWEVGDKGFIIYTYTADGGTVVPVTVSSVMDSRAMIGVQVPSMFGGDRTFGILCWPHQIYLTEQRATEVMKAEGLDKPLPDDVEF